MMAEYISAVFVLSRGTVPRWQLISIRGLRHWRFDPAPGIDLIKQQLEGIVGGDGYLHHLSRSSISAIEQLADCRNPSSLALCSQRQACQLDNNRRRMLGAVAGGRARTEVQGGTERRLRCGSAGWWR